MLSGGLSCLSEIPHSPTSAPFHVGMSSQKEDIRPGLSPSCLQLQKTESSGAHYSNRLGGLASQAATNALQTAGPKVGKETLDLLTLPLGRVAGGWQGPWLITFPMAVTNYLARAARRLMFESTVSHGGRSWLRDL